MGITGDPAATSDSDELPRGQKRSGDGYSLFEEYGGLIAVDHIIVKADKLAKPGKHVRMNPNHNDVAILDESGLFKKYYAAPNPAELTWHSTISNKRPQRVACIPAP